MNTWSKIILKLKINLDYNYASTLIYYIWLMESIIYVKKIGAISQYCTYTSTLLNHFPKTKWVILVMSSTN